MNRTARLQALTALASLILASCGDEPAAPVPRALASFSMTNISPTAGEKAAPHRLGGEGELDACNNPGWRCEDATTLAVRLSSVYLTEDRDPETGGNIGETEAIYGAPACGLEPAADGVIVQPDLGACSLDLGLISSAGVEITSRPDFLELARPPAAVQADLQAASFAIAPGTYRYVAVVMGSNAIEPPADGTQDSVAPGTTMNLRFQSAGMASAYELRISNLGRTLQLGQPLTLAEGQTVGVELQYNLARAIVVIPEGAAFDPGLCTPVQGGVHYCIDPQRLDLHPVITVDDVVVPELLAASTIDADGDGQIDHLRLTFSAPVRDNRFPGQVANGLGDPQTSWLVAGRAGAVMAHGSAAPSGFTDAIDDAVIYLRFDESGTPDTNLAPDVTTTATPGLTGAGGQPIGRVTSATVVETDGALPVIVRATSQAGASSLVVELSEPVTTSATGACAAIAAATDLAYSDLSLSGVAGLSATGALDLDGCDGILSVATAPGAITAADLQADQVAAVAGRIRDLVGNVAATAPRALTGVTPPYLLAAVSASPTTARIYYSEAVNATAALTLANHGISVASGSGCGTPSLATVVAIRPEVYEVTTSAQIAGCTYALAVASTIRDLDENATMTTPRVQSFVASEPLGVVLAVSLSETSLEVVLSKPVEATDAANPSNFRLSPALGSVVGATRSATDTSRVVLTHSQPQAGALYTVVVTGLVRAEGSAESVAPEPRDRGLFLGAGAPVVSVAQGPFLADPFGDGATSTWTFRYANQIYVGPDAWSSAAFRFAADGSKPIAARFLSRSASVAAVHPSFGANLRRPAAVISRPTGATTQYQLTPGTNLRPFANATDAVTVTVTGCANPTNNLSATGATGSPGSGATILLDDALDTVQLTGGGTASGIETCSVELVRSIGPAGFSGLDALVAATVGGQEYLVYGGHLHGSAAGFAELQFTRDLDLVLNNDYCNLASVTPSNTQSLQSIFGNTDKLYLGFTGNGANRPVLARHDLSVLGSGTTPCGGLSDAVTATSSRQARYIPQVGSSAGNTALVAGIDSMATFDDGGGSRFFVANNGGVAATLGVPGPTSVWSAVRFSGDGTWAGTSVAVSDLGPSRPGNRGVPFLVTWGNTLLVARNRSDSARAELWRYRETGAGPASPDPDWTRLIDTSSTTGGMNPNDARISLLVVSGDRLYVGFDNPTQGIELWRTKAGVVATSVASVLDFERVGVSGLGPASSAELGFNKSILSHATAPEAATFVLYLTVGCDLDYRDNGACDRDPTVGATDFSVRLFRQENP